MRSFVVQFFFQDSLCGWLKNLYVFNVVPFFNSTGLAIVAEAELRCGEFSSEKVVVTNW